MTKIWREIADPAKHRDYMSTYVEGGIPVEPRADNLVKKWVYFTSVDGFVFQFASLEQVRECRDYFSQKHHPSGRNPNQNPHEHYWHPWFERLPKGMMKEKNRLLVIKAMDAIQEKWG